MKLIEAIISYIATGDGEFNPLALAVFAYQYQHCQPYQSYCQQLARTPDNVIHWHEIPAVSTEVFREFACCTFDKTEATVVFQTSGTTNDDKGQHYHRNLQLYNTVIRASFRSGLRLSQQPVTFRIITPSFDDVPSSSLFYMLQRAKEWYGDAASKFYYKNSTINYDELLIDLAQDIALGRQVVLLGTAFSWVNFFDHTPFTLQLPQGSILMETGGLKGRSRSVTRAELYALFATRLGLDRDCCYSEYGMTELSSQCYSKPNSHIFNSPAWMPVRLINPITLQEATVGETGVIQFFDLANLEAISAIMTADLAIKHTDGFELIGRAPLAALRGCSLAFE